MLVEANEEAITRDANPRSNRTAEAAHNPGAVDLTFVAMALTALLGLQPVFNAGRNGAPSIGTVGAELGVYLTRWDAGR
jgi:hypothetical protein